MMNHLITVICLILLTATPILASQRTGHQPEGICTRDINPWGHASSCTCNTDQVYEQRAGLCLEGSVDKKIIVQGSVTADAVAIGAETTGFIIKTPEHKSYELFLKMEDQEKIKKIRGMWFEIEGELITIRSVELKQREAIIVKRLAVHE